MEAKLPQRRIRSIMKCTMEMSNVTKEVLYLMTKTAETFIEHLSRESYNNANKPQTLEYKHLADLVQKNHNFVFMQQILPQKIKVKEFRTLIEKDNGTSDSPTESD